MYRSSPTFNSIPQRAFFTEELSFSLHSLDLQLTLAFNLPEITTMGKLVEGRWNQFEFRSATPADYADILDYLHNNFYREEIISQLVGYSKENALSFDQKIVSYLTQNLSFIAVDCETNKIAGLRVMYESSQDEYSSSPSICLEKNRIFQFLTELEDKCNIFSMFHVTRCAKLLLTSVSPEYREQGLGTEMYKRSIDMLSTRGFGMVKGSFCNPQTIKIAQKLGFQELARSYVRDFRDENGNPIIECRDFEFVALMALKL